MKTNCSVCSKELDGDSWEGYIEIGGVDYCWACYTQKEKIRLRKENSEAKVYWDNIEKTWRLSLTQLERS
jgi:hypothetical protein